MQDNIKIGERIKKIREDLKMSREKFSEMIDISDVFLGQLERGDRSLSTKTLVKIVSFTGILLILFYSVLRLLIIKFQKLIEF